MCACSCEDLSSFIAIKYITGRNGNKILKNTEILGNNFRFLTKVSMFRFFWHFSKGIVKQISNSVSTILFAVTPGSGAYHNSMKL